MKDNQYQCFTLAFEKAREMNMERSTAGFIVHENELEMLLYLSPRDYVKCLMGYSDELGKVDSLIGNGELSKDKIKGHMRKISYAIDVITPIHARKIKDVEIYCDGDGDVVSLARYFTNECFKKSVELAEKIEGLMRDNDILFLADEESEKVKYKSEIEKLWYEDDIALFNKLRDFITKSQAVRKNGKPISDDLYKKLIRWESELKDLPDYTRFDMDNENKKKYDVIEGLRVRCLDELGHLLRVYASQKKNGENLNNSREKIERPIRNIKIGGYSNEDKGKERSTEIKEPLQKVNGKKDKNKPWYKDPYSKWVDGQ